MTLIIHFNILIGAVMVVIKWNGSWITNYIYNLCHQCLNLIKVATHPYFTSRQCYLILETDPCNPNPCPRGRCKIVGNSYSCKCYSSYSGSTCSGKSFFYFRIMILTLFNDLQAYALFPLLKSILCL